MMTPAEANGSEPGLLIFDCDGVLVDSEMLVCTAVSEVLTRLGYPITPEDVVRRFSGRPEREILLEVADDWGRPVPAAYDTAMEERVHRAYASELRAVARVPEVIGRLRVPKVVASSSAPAKLEQGLRLVGLYPHFAPNIVSVHSVAAGKPSPDVFVFAAGWMRTSVQQCLVIEDSVPGVRAACAAGMRVWGFTGGSHCSPGHDRRLLDAGAERVFTHMHELPDVLPQAFDPEPVAFEA